MCATRGAAAGPRRGDCSAGTEAVPGPGSARRHPSPGVMILYYTDTILYYIILYYTILYYIILYYTILYYILLYYTILAPTWQRPRTLHGRCTILYYIILYYTIFYYIIVYCIVLY